MPTSIIDSFPRQNPRAAMRTIEDQTVVVIPDTSMLFDLNEVASFIWKRMDGRHNLKKIIEEVENEFDIDHETATGDAVELIENMKEAGLAVFDTE
mgnify:CR=1 FL=1